MWKFITVCICVYIHGRMKVCVFTSLECVRFWCLARSEALEKALLQPSCSHTYGFSPVCERRWVFRFSRREYALEQPSNWNTHTHTHKAQIKTLLESITRVVPIQIISSVIHFPLCWRKEKLIAARSNHSHVSSLHKRCHWFCADHHIYMNAFDRCFFPKWLAFKVFLCTAFPWKLTLDLGVARVTVWNYAWYENFNMFNAFVCSFYLLLKYFLKYKNASSLRFVSVVGDICSIYLFYLFKV